MSYEAEEIVTFANLDAVEALQASDEAECDQQYRSTVEKLADDQEVRRDELLRICHYRKKTIEQLHEDVKVERERKKKAAERLELIAQNVGHAEARQIYHDLQTERDRVHKEFEDKIDVAYRNVRFLEGLPGQIRAIELELRQSAPIQYHTARIAAEAAIAPARQALALAEAAEVEAVSFMKAVRKANESFVDDGSELYRMTRGRLPMAQQRMTTATERVSELRKQLEDALSRKLRADNAAICLTAV